MRESGRSTLWHGMVAELLPVGARDRGKHLALHLRADPLPERENGLRFARGGGRVELLCTRGGILAEPGRPVKAEEAFRIALTEAREGGPIERLRLIRLGQAGAVFAQGRDARPILDELEPALPDDPEPWPRLGACRGRGLLRLGEGEAARPVLEGASRGVRAVEAPGVEVEILSDLAELAGRAGDRREERRLVAEALDSLGPKGSEKAHRLRDRLQRSGAGP